MAYELPILNYLSSDGTTSGTKDMATTADEYYFTMPSAGYIHRMLVSYEDEGGGVVGEYGNLGAALTNGILVRVIADDGTTVLQDLLDGIPIKTNGQWARVCYDHQVLNYGAGTDLWCTRWTFDKTGRPLFLQAGQRISMEIQDDLTNLSSHFAMVQGYTG